MSLPNFEHSHQTYQSLWKWPFPHWRQKEFFIDLISLLQIKRTYIIHKKLIINLFSQKPLNWYINCSNINELKGNTFQTFPVSFFFVVFLAGNGFYWAILRQLVGMYSKLEQGKFRNQIRAEQYDDKGKVWLKWNVAADYLCGRNGFRGGICLF